MHHRDAFNSTCVFFHLKETRFDTLLHPKFMQLSCYCFIGNEIRKPMFALPEKCLQISAFLLQSQVWYTSERSVQE